MDVIAHLSLDEQRVIAFLVDCFEHDRRVFQTSAVHDALNMTHDQLMRNVRRVVGLGVAGITDAGDDLLVEPHPKCVEIHREIVRRSQATPDLVDEIQRRFRSNRKIAWTIVILVGLAVLVSLINGIFDLVDRFIRR